MLDAITFSHCFAAQHIQVEAQSQVEVALVKPCRSTQGGWGIKR